MLLFVDINDMLEAFIPVLFAMKISPLSFQIFNSLAVFISPMIYICEAVLGFGILNVDANGWLIS